MCQCGMHDHLLEPKVCGGGVAASLIVQPWQRVRCWAGRGGGVGGHVRELLNEVSVRYAGLR